MPAFGSLGHPPVPLTRYLFIDGAALAATLDDLETRCLGGFRPGIDWTRMAGSFRKVFYYDAVPVKKIDEDENTYAARVRPKREELKAIERQDRCHVRSGDVRNRTKSGREQKMVDVHLAVDALLMASRGLFSSVTLITSDLDFKPLLDALVAIGVDVELRYQAGHTNSELIAAADRATPIDLVSYREWAADQSVIPTSHLPFAFPEEIMPPEANPIWYDTKGFGRCFVHKTAFGHRLCTETHPTSENHRLVVDARTVDALRGYCDNIYGLSVP